MDMEIETENARSIPEFVNVDAFVGARRVEIAALTKTLGVNQKTTTIFQRLPKYMRRRAMSHTVKRMPRKLRDAHERQLMKGNALKKSKRPRKKYRKRIRNVALAYRRRQNQNSWLETHIWHAKRFRMVEKWGYKLPERSYNKMFKASYRATISNCLIQDISYYGCVEIVGPFEILADRFKQITNQACGLSISAMCWTTGGREGEAMVFYPGAYPYRPLGQITFIWKPERLLKEPPIGEPISRTIWMWCHPSYYNEFVELLRHLFDLKESDVPDDDTMAILNKKNVKLSTINTPKFLNEESGITMTLLKHALNRIRLTGPLSGAVLTKALHSADGFDNPLMVDSADDMCWWKDVRKGRQFEKTTGGLAILNSYGKPGQLPCKLIMGDHIIDPRLFLPQVRTRTRHLMNENKRIDSVPAGLSETSVWDPKVRHWCRLNKYSTAELNNLRKKLLVPGSDDQLLMRVKSVIPILLVHNPGCSSESVRVGYGSGWDVILPADWARPVWLALILCGAKPGGLREATTINFESKKLPVLSPDTRAGRIYYEEIKQQAEDLYFRKPPNKRPNYIKTGFPTPFHYPWARLLREWAMIDESDIDPVSDEFCILREKRTLRELSEQLVLRSPKDLPTFRDRYLVPVCIQMLTSGTISAFSHVCVPTATDLRQRKLSPESPHHDINNDARNALKMSHRAVLRRLKRRRRKNDVGASSAEEVAKYTSRMKELWISSNNSSLRYHCARQICGFVTIGGFSQLNGLVLAQGYITLEAIHTLIDLYTEVKCKPLILVRSPDNLNYKLGCLNVVQ